MASENPSILSRLKSEAATMSGDARTMLAARLELARLDMAGHVYQIKRLSVALAFWITVTTVASIGLVSLGVLLAQRWAVAVYDETWGNALVGGACLLLALLGLLAAWLRWRSFQRDFRFMEDTLAELHEDLIWLGEWTGETGDRPESLDE